MTVSPTPSTTYGLRMFAAVTRDTDSLEIGHLESTRIGESVKGIDVIHLVTQDRVRGCTTQGTQLMVRLLHEPRPYPDPVLVVPTLYPTPTPALVLDVPLGAALLAWAEEHGAGG